MILLTGGTGYVGSHLLGTLRQRNEPVRVLVRDPEKQQHLATGNVELAQGDVTDPQSVRAAMQCVDTVIHLAAIIREQPGGPTFEQVNNGGTVNVVDAAREARVTRLLHQSVLVARPDPKLAYFATRYRSEEYVQQSALQYTIVRPSVIIGEGDQFVNKLADLVRKPLLVLPAPIVPVVGDGSTPFSPVWITDFVDAIIGLLDKPEWDNQVYELGGPRTLTYAQMLDEIMVVLGIKRRRVHVPIRLMQVLALALGKVMANPPVTLEELRLLQMNNAAPPNATSLLAGHDLMDFRDGITYVKTPIEQQQRHVRAWASGKAEAVG